MAGTAAKKYQLEGLGHLIEFSKRTTMEKDEIVRECAGNLQTTASFGMEENEESYSETDIQLCQLQEEERREPGQE